MSVGRVLALVLGYVYRVVTMTLFAPFHIHWAVLKVFFRRLPSLGPLLSDWPVDHVVEAYLTVLPSSGSSYS